MPASACTSTASSILVSDPRHLRSPLEAVAAVTDLGFGLVLAPVRMATGGARRAIDVRWAVRRVARRAVRVRRDRVQGG
jgi:lactate dehydrogenase-like 2-hydroxyacid dehydrogenase